MVLYFASFVTRMVFSEVITTSSAIDQGDFRLYAFRDAASFVNAQVEDAAEVTTLSVSQLVVTTTINSSQTLIGLTFDAIPRTSDTVGYLVGFINEGSASGGCYLVSSSGSYPYPGREQGDRCLGASQILIERMIVNVRVFLGGSF